MQPDYKALLSPTADFGRVLGATAIFYYHAGLRTDFPLSIWGEYAVDFFIILAGIAYECFSSIRPADAPSYRRYVGGRLWAIFPMFVVINIAIFAISYVYPSALGRPFSFGELLLSAAGLSQYFGARYLSIVMWFVPFIIQAYLVFPVIDACLNRISSLWVMLGAWAICIPLMVAVCFYWPDAAPLICRRWCVLLRLPEVCLGILAGRWLCGAPERASEAKTDVATLALYAIVAFLLTTPVSPFLVLHEFEFSLFWRGLVVTMVIAAAALATAVIFGRAGNARWLRLAGNASFPFFLTHGVAIVFIYHRFGARVAAWVGYYLLCWGGAVLLTVAFQYGTRAWRGSARET